MMNMKKLDRLKQWAGERMGGEAKTNTTEDFKALEVEMTMRHDGMESLHKSMTTYMKSLSKRQEGDDREKALSVGNLGSTMVNHGQDFQTDSEFGNCLISMIIDVLGYKRRLMRDIALGRANEIIARKQEGYVTAATSSWLESLERSLAQMKEYQAARKKLEQRRLAYDASLAKVQKAKREDFRVEEELRSQKAKYEESSDDVLRRMQEIQESEVESAADLTGMLDAQLAYYDNCREVLLQVKREWPTSGNIFHDPNDDYAAYQSHSPTNTHASTTSTASEVDVGFVKKAPPPPPPSRVKKAAPPPVPGKKFVGLG
ncbi:BAR-domain-containing protein [Eremomyces bilateralis CBS 781.70]|uniref:BAR-domain-containing protein n=1 Tax=Eremomyces bilateralis CBS 781.70 TaxID=1392243 RepID=A0A6G1FUD8_9PEZI|nr:BAR-domain-containing protein [Eremomyces bilateralis CBS 781.70]KAF1809279.1 BAR-domain-containing protein [Eremomyces bilateralis CBS 781.70]